MGSGYGEERPDLASLHSSTWSAGEEHPGLAALHTSYMSAAGEHHDVASLPSHRVAPETYWGPLRRRWALAGQTGSTGPGFHVGIWRPLLTSF